jgi:UDP-N-acetylmuramate dehydrogenase
VSGVPGPEPGTEAGVSGVPGPEAGVGGVPGPEPGTAREPFDAVRLGGEIQRRIGAKTVRDESLARHTTMRVGGPADLYVVVHNAFELRAIVRFVRARGIPHLLLGRGSDLVVSDAGVRGVVIHVRAEGLDVAGDMLVAEAGVPLARVATVAQGAALTGAEFALAIPGSLGGAVWANAGAHGVEMADVLETVDVVVADGTEARLPASALGFGYRDSRLKHPATGTNGDVVVSATLRLRPEDPAVVATRLDEVRRWRREHQPLGIPSAGSVFRNPEGDSAGRLIEAAGLKGRRTGGAVVSEKHANWILNDRKGTATDVRSLADLVRATVRDRFGVDLVPEVEFVGDWPDAADRPPDASRPADATPPADAAADGR